MKINVLILAIFCSLTALAPAAGRQDLKCYNVPKEARLYPLGLMNPDTILRLAIQMPVRDQSQLDQLTQGISDPKSPEYKHYLSPQEFAQRFGSTQANYDAIIAFFQSRGFTVTRYPNRLLLDVVGTIKLIEETFHTTLRLYKHPTENRNFYAPDENPTVDLDIPLSNVAGLDNFTLFHPLLSK
jgi:subtilase family serine protease